MAETTDVRPEPHWPASLALLACAGLYVLLPSRLVVGPKWLLPILVVLPLIPLSARRHRHPDEAPWIRTICIALLIIITVANCTSVVLLVDRVFFSSHLQGRGLIYSAASIWCTNVIVFGLWLWEMDRGGPHLRAGKNLNYPDVQFPQMENPTLALSTWRPRFVDYLYTSFANGTSFAPADAMPLSLRAKGLFAAEALVSFVTIAVIAGEAVNILH